jgi:hypothetical protein
MENIAVNPKKIAFKWSLIYLVTSIVITYLFQFMNVDQSSGAKYISYIPFLVYLLLAQKEYKDGLGGYLTFGEGFSTGFLFSIFSGLLLAVFVYIYLSFLSPQIFEQAINTAQDKLTEQGNLSSQQIDTAMQITRKYGVILGTVGAVFGSAIIGAIFALIGAAIFKNPRPPFEADSYTDPTV